MRRLVVVLGFFIVAGCGGNGSPTPTSPAPVAQTRIIRLEAILQFGDVPVGGSATRDLRIVPSRLGDRAGVIGAATMAIEHVLSPDAVDRALEHAA